MHSNARNEPVIYLSVILSALCIFTLDVMTPPGTTEWLFYMLPVALCALQSRPFFVVATTGVSSVLLFIGLLVYARSGIPDTSILNRSYGVISLWAIAFLVRQVIVSRNRVERMAWINDGQMRVSQSMLGELSIAEVGGNVLRELTQYLGAAVGAVYHLDNNMLVRSATYGLRSNEDAPPRIAPGEGIAGQAARDRKVVQLADLPPDHLRIESATGASRAARVTVAPLTADGVVYGVVELGFTGAGACMADERELLERIADNVGVGLRSAVYRVRLLELLEETQQQSEELQAQQEELRVSNEELEEQSRILRESQTRLEAQQAELEQSNLQLEEQTSRLEGQKQDLLAAQRSLRDNAAELERANRYKSEFLANMSHELRTPLNSSLILSKLLADNKNGGLTEEQVRHARTIHAANSDLLNLINEILDLSKIESGHLSIEPESHSLSSILETLRQTFEPVAHQRGLAFHFEIETDAPVRLVTDAQRLQQILKNLLSNAFKFTERGSVSLIVGPASHGKVSFSVRDTGVGIAPHQQEVIFEAFRQADGTTSRKYGGTGLGLSISRELARLLGGAITVESAQGQGSTFTLTVPVNVEDAQAVEQASQASDTASVRPTQAPVVERIAEQAASAPAPSPHITDDRDQPLHHERLILLVEDDMRFAAVLYELAHELGFDCVHASTAADAIRLARELTPSGILLDIELPDLSGLSVLERLKRDSATRHIPVHMVSVSDHVQTALELGAVGYALKPVARDEIEQAIHRLENQLRSRMRRVLVVEDDDSLRANIGLLLGAEDVEIVGVGTAAGALELLSASTFDCMVMDLMLPDASGYTLLEAMASGGKYAFPPVIVYTGRALTRQDEERLRRYSRSIIIKGAKSPERLLDEVSLFLHRVESTLPPDKQRLLRQARQRDQVFEERRLLLVEDDIRNIYALSAVFESLGATLEICRNGREALERIGTEEPVDLVLMDIMMPEMDGLTAIRHIRAMPDRQRLPIIALTAKAMADDRQHCLEAGANDYVAKPVDIDRLVSLCRVWMPK
ncbi:response regulator [Uliginosibacterium sp. sgz301328]|uniref:response regulator n=1 Tax=Uliginosibacterium sp. sgz301328 TaxID=3243764 RepID=UPI00359E2D2D